MSKWMRFGAAALLTLTLFSVSGALLLECMTPMEDQTYDLSLVWKGEALPEGWVYDQKGWTVFTQEGETVTKLSPDGFGGFSGPVEPGQTFYFSRVLTEKLYSPILCLGTADRTFAVFLDGNLLYTDCPESDNRMGHLHLPTLEQHRTDPLLVTLPLDYAGKTLTIAQSSPLRSEKEGTVWPCAVTLYRSYAYESTLVAESFQTAVLVTLAFAAGTLLLALFTLQALRGTPDLGTLCGGLMAFFWLAGWLTLALLPPAFGPLPADVATLARDLSLTLLLVFLASRLTGRRRFLLWLFAGAQGAASAALAVLQITEQLTLTFAQAVPVVSLAGLAAAMVCGALEWKRNCFFRCFCSLTALGTVLWAALGYWQFDGHSPGMLLWPLAGIMTAAAMVTALAEAVRRETVRRTQARLLAQRSEMAQSSYKALQRQNEQVMMLRHDMMKHFQLLQLTTHDEQTAAYLDELMGENAKIRPVIQSGNEMLDIILNGKLIAAADAGIAVELARTNAPDKLPLTDVELCSLMMNLLDNALEAASAPGVKRRYIRLDMQIRNSFFVFACENGTTLEWVNKETAPERGLGLKVIRQIVERYGNLLKTEYGEEFYKVTVMLPLHQPLK